MYRGENGDKKPVEPPNIPQQRESVEHGSLYLDHVVIDCVLQHVPRVEVIRSVDYLHLIYGEEDVFFLRDIVDCYDCVILTTQLGLLDLLN